MHIVQQIVDTTLQSFDVGFCVAVNVLTYLVITLIDSFNGDKVVSTWIKRLVMVSSVLVIAVAYYLMHEDTKLILNSAILAPVFWSWIGRPICDKLGINYKKEVSDENKD